MNQVIKKTRGHGIEEFEKNLIFIKAQIEKGQSASSIYKSLLSKEEVSIGVVLFRRYVRKLKESMAGERSSVQSAPVSVSAPSPSSPKFSSNASPVVVGSSIPPRFQPEPADMDDEFSSDQEGDAS